MKISLNDNLYEFKMFGINMCSEFDIYDRGTETSGTFSIYSMYDDNFSIINNVILLNDNLDHQIILGEPCEVQKCKDNLITLKFSITDIFEFHKRMTKLLIFDSIDQKILHSLRCFNLPLICNLKCPYCSQGYIHKHEAKYFDKHITASYITKEQESINTLIDDNSITDRYMGGETLINWDEFVNTVDFYSSHFLNSNNFRIYTNGTIADSITKLENYILNSSRYHHFDIWFTVDSFNVSTSARIKDQQTMSNLMSNLATLFGMKHMLNVQINFNIMYNNSPKEFISVLKTLFNMGFKHFKLGFDESNTYYVNHERKFRIIPRLINICKKYMIPTKMDVDRLLIYKFDIKDFGTEVYSNKLSIMTNRNHIEIYESVIDSNVDSVHQCRKLIKVED